MTTAVQQTPAEALAAFNGAYQQYIDGLFALRTAAEALAATMPAEAETAKLAKCFTDELARRRREWNLRDRVHKVVLAA